MANKSPTWYRYGCRPGHGTFPFFFGRYWNQYRKKFVPKKYHYRNQKKWYWYWKYLFKKVPISEPEEFGTEKKVLVLVRDFLVPLHSADWSFASFAMFYYIFKLYCIVCHLPFAICHLWIAGAGVGANAHVLPFLQVGPTSVVVLGE